MHESKLVGKLVVLFAESGLVEQGLILEVDKQLNATVKWLRVSRPDTEVGPLPHMTEPPKTKVIGRPNTQFVGWKLRSE